MPFTTAPTRHRCGTPVPGPAEERPLNRSDLSGELDRLDLLRAKKARLAGWPRVASAAMIFKDQREHRIVLIVVLAWAVAMVLAWFFFEVLGPHGYR